MAESTQPEKARQAPSPSARCFGRILFATYGGMRIDPQCHQCQLRKAGMQDIRGWLGYMRPPVTMPEVGEDGVCRNRVSA